MRRMPPKKAPTKALSFPSSKSTTSAPKKVLKTSRPEPYAEEIRFDGDLDLEGYPALYAVARKEMGSPSQSISFPPSLLLLTSEGVVHAEGFSQITVILRVFDTTIEWGPGSNMTRLERWERAKGLGLAVPEEVG